jgi:putative tryptophan/tyrosine transport system substrate-binding protein
MQRREFITLVGGAVTVWSLGARAQQRPPGIALLISGAADSSAILVDAFKAGMSDNGLVEARDYVLDVRFADGNYSRFPMLAVEVAQRKPAAIVVTTISAALAAQRASTTIPIVMTGLIDPVGAGLITSLARPGGNTTGMSSMAQDMTSKGLELLKTVVPTARTIAALFNPANAGNRQIMEDVRIQANMLGLTILPVEFKGPAALDATFDTAASLHPDALLVVGDAALIDLREHIAALALRHRLPTVSSIPELTDAGGLIGYGPPRREMYRRAANYVKKVLDGSAPANLPVEQPTLIELSINLQTAKALGLTIPESLLIRADKLIE